MANWQLSGNIMEFAGLRLAIQRIALSYWSPNDRLRSWGSVPLHPEGDTLYVPCADTEALWIGAWIEDSATELTVSLRDTASGNNATIRVPGDYQLSALDADGKPIEPLALAGYDARRTFELSVFSSEISNSLKLVLLSPSSWSVKAARVAPDALGAAPPLPPRLG